MEIGKQVIDIAMENGADMAGIANMEALRASPSHVVYPQMEDYKGVGTVKEGDILPKSQFFNWPESVKSVLVIGLSHPKDRPELDWWDGRGTPGNRMLIDIMKKNRERIENDLKLVTHPLHYYVEKGGVFLKDAAVLAGFGCIGKNNMLVTPDYGPRIRLRALFIDDEIPPDGPSGFDPCEDCKVYCRKVCPEKAMSAKAPVFETIGAPVEIPARDGFYARNMCNDRMEKDIAESKAGGSETQGPVKYCRKCEFVCPAGKG